MSDILLATKFYIPPARAEIVRRMRLIECLDSGLNCKLTLISAPAGYGKTTLLSAWIRGCDFPTVWLSLDEGDNHLPLFFSYLITALQKINGQFGKILLGRFISSQRVDMWKHLSR
jgi:LuxR family maltose regulon positive regulatory protein